MLQCAQQRPQTPNGFPEITVRHWLMQKTKDMIRHAYDMAQVAMPHQDL